VNFALPGFAPKKVSSNGKASSATLDQRARVADYKRALDEASMWKAGCKVLGGCLVASTLTIGVLAHANSPRVVGWVADANGVQHYVGDAQGAVTASEATVDATIIVFVKDLRQVSGSSDYRFIDDNTGQAHRMCVTGSPAERDLLAYFKDHNPKTQARTLTRIVLDKNPSPIVQRAGDSLTWNITYSEQVKGNDGVLRPPMLYTGSVTLAHEPTLPTDRVEALENPGGLAIQSFVLPVSD
jgi:type IV secretory pathway TrbF-like protein